MTNQVTLKPHGNLKLCDSMIAALSDLVSKGNYYVTACNICGISEFAFYEWINLAERDDRAGLSESNSLYIRLAKSLKKAEAEAESKILAVVLESAEVKREWLPAMTFLERRHPDRWGRKDRTAITIDEHKQIIITHVEIVKPGDYAGQIVESDARELPEGKTDADPGH